MNNHNFDKQAWAKMSAFEQMGNIGSEVGRALSAKRYKDEQSMSAAFYRGLDLIDETAKLWAKTNPSRTKELLRSREVFATAIITDKSDDQLETYFMNFAIAARLNS